MKAINTLSIEKAQLEERVKSLTGDNAGLQEVIDKNQAQINEYQLQVDELDKAIKELQGLK